MLDIGLLKLFTLINTADMLFFDMLQHSVRFIKILFTFLSYKHRPDKGVNSKIEFKNTPDIQSKPVSYNFAYSPLK